MIKTEYQRICKRFDDVMDYIGCEFLEICNENSDIYRKRNHYCIQKGITLSWMLDEAEWWLSCYYEPGNVRADDKHYDAECYKTWLAETGRLKRLITAIKKFDNLNECVEVQS